MRLVVSLALTLSLLTCALDAHASTRQARSYFEIRDRSPQLIQGALPADLLSQPDRYAERLVEVRGIISGVTESTDAITLLLTQENGATAVVVVPVDQRGKYGTLFDFNSALRALCHVVSLPTGAALQLVVPVRERDAAEAERERVVATQQQAVRRAVTTRSRRTSRSLASRRMSRRTAAGPTAAGLTYAETLARYASAVRYFNRRVSPYEAEKIAAIILEYGTGYGLDPRLVMAIIAVESNFNAGAVSHAGAQGLGQLMPGTASDLGVGNPFDHQQNIAGSTRLLRRHIDDMRARNMAPEEAVKLALACYNAGAGAVRKFKGIPPYRETQAYVKKVLRLYYQLAPDQAPENRVR